MKNSPQTRKEHSENRLSELGIIHNPHLPLTFEGKDVKIRTSKEIASKIVALWEVVNIANNIEESSRKESVEFLTDENLWGSLSPIEKDFLIKTIHSEQKVIDLTWRTEVLKVFYWALDEISLLGEPIEDLSIVQISDRVIEKYSSVDSFLNETILRSKEEILDEADFIYRLHWSSKPHRRNNQNVPSNYNYSVIRERDFALRWLTQPEAHWDEISLDT